MKSVTESAKEQVIRILETHLKSDYEECAAAYEAYRESQSSIATKIKEQAKNECPFLTGSGRCKCYGCILFCDDGICEIFSDDYRRLTANAKPEVP